jgi:hypothetical protein
VLAETKGPAVIYASKRLIRKYPNLLVLLAGLWMATSPVAFVFYVEDHVMTSGVRPAGLDAFLYFVHSLRYGEITAIAIFFLGCGITLAAIFRMIRPWIWRWIVPR